MSLETKVAFIVETGSYNYKYDGQTSLIGIWEQYDEALNAVSEWLVECEYMNDVDKIRLDEDGSFYIVRYGYEDYIEIRRIYLNTDKPYWHNHD